MGWGMGAWIAIVLAVAGPAYAQGGQEPINGRWAIDPEGCKIEGDTTETAPLYITDPDVQMVDVGLQGRQELQGRPRPLHPGALLG